jgi:16S rRNA (cytosine1402-N4)-methyltransferase
MRHTPVLLKQVIDDLAIKKGSIFVDCNLGDGGHSEEVLKRTKGEVTIIGIDLDPEALKRAKDNLQKHESKKQSKIYYCQDNFANIAELVREAMEKVTAGSTVDAVLFDLGLSSYELEEGGRGFSFKSEDPLEMTFGARDKYNFNAADIVNNWSVDQIETIIKSYGEEKFAGRIARKIVETRDGAPIKTAKQLADLIRSTYPSMLRFGRIHPATKTFQALRMAVNDELTTLSQGLEGAVQILKLGGRLAVISYHSLEDRIVKQYFKKVEEEGKVYIITKKPIVPGKEEMKENPRSRSAKLRIIEKI